MFNGGFLFTWPGNFSNEQSCKALPIAEAQILLSSSIISLNRSDPNTKKINGGDT
jgi:hypothetical protein